MISIKSLTYGSISGIVFPTILLMTFPEGSTISTVSNILLTFFSCVLFIVTIIGGCGQKEVLINEESYDIPLFEAFASSFGDEYAIVWKKTNELVDISGNNGMLSYAEAHHVLNDYLKHNPDKIWGIQIVPHVEIVTQILPDKEAEDIRHADVVEEISTVKSAEDLVTIDEIEKISPIEEIKYLPVEATEVTLPNEDIEDQHSDIVDEEITPIYEKQEIITRDETEPLPLIKHTETISETEMTVETSTRDDTDEKTTTDEIEDKSQIDEIHEIPAVDGVADKFETEEIVELSAVEETQFKILTEERDEIDDLPIEKTEDISIVEENQDLESISEVDEFPKIEVLEEIPPENDREPRIKEPLLSNLPSPYIIISNVEEEISPTKEIEDLPLIEEISQIKDLEEVPSEKITEPRDKRELLSNIPKPYIILDSVEEIDKTSDKDELKEILEEE